MWSNVIHDADGDLVSRHGGVSVNGVPAGENTPCGGVGATWTLPAETAAGSVEPPGAAVRSTGPPSAPVTILKPRRGRRVSSWPT
jgi:hypothetical protein